MRHSYTILYIDDDHDDLALITEAFQQYTEKLTVVHANNGKEGLLMLHEMKDAHTLPCLVIMDINMPVMNGLEALSHIRSVEAFTHIPVVLFSTSSSNVDERTAQQYGADFITKPNRYEDLQELVQQFVSRCVFESETRLLTS